MRQPSVAEAQAMGLCLLARQKGLPDIASLRSAVAQLHADVCRYCALSSDELLEVLYVYHPMAVDESRWWSLPARAKGEAIRLAQQVPA